MTLGILVGPREDNVVYRWIFYRLVFDDMRHAFEKETPAKLSFWSFEGAVLMFALGWRRASARPR